MLVNLSNHPSGFWSEEQLAAARQFGDIVDLQFPTIDPSLSSAAVSSIADKTVDTIMALGKDVVVHVMGEMTFTVALLKRLQSHNITCVASTTKRIVHEMPNGDKTVKFQFNQFRRYE